MWPLCSAAVWLPAVHALQIHLPVNFITRNWQTVTAQSGASFTPSQWKRRSSVQTQTPSQTHRGVHVSAIYNLWSQMWDRCSLQLYPKTQFSMFRFVYSLWIAESFGQVQKLCRNKIIFIFISPKFEAFWHLDTSETLRNQSQRLWFIEFHLLLFTAAFVILLLLWFHTLQALRRWPEKYELRF